MSENNEGMTENIDPKLFNIAAIGDPTDPDVLLVAFPVKHWANLKADGYTGMDVAYGVCRKVEAIVVTSMKAHLQKKQRIQPGVIMPDGKPLMVS